MIPGNVSNNRAFGFREPGQFRVRNQIPGMLMVRIVRDVITDVMQQCSCQQERPVMSCKGFSGGKKVKDLCRQFCHLMSVACFISKPPAYSIDSAKFLIGEVCKRCSRFIFPFPQMVDDHSFAQSPIACSQGVDSKGAHCTFEYLTTSYDDLGALRG